VRDDHLHRNQKPHQFYFTFRNKTMAEFDSAGFAAVENFFGSYDEDAQANALPNKSKSSLSAPSKRRGGVGAAIAKKDTSAQKLAVSVLKVGRKRSRDGGDDDSDREFYDDDDDDELEAGRTAIAKEDKKKIKDLDQVVIESQKKGKKKRGKKERQQQNQVNIEPADVHVPSSTENPGDSTTEANTTTKNQKPQRKRKKVRSKQKNIRKDHRTMPEKPGHLIPGNPNYQGRPLTQATRERLRNPAPVGKKIVGDSDNISGEAKNHKTGHVKESTPSKATSSQDRSSEIEASENKEAEPVFVIDRIGDDVGIVVDTNRSTNATKLAAAAKIETKSNKKKKQKSSFGAS
jgi:hypothetical protein